MGREATEDCPSSNVMAGQSGEYRIYFVRMASHPLKLAKSTYLCEVSICFNWTNFPFVHPGCHLGRSPGSTPVVPSITTITGISLEIWRSKKFTKWPVTLACHACHARSSRPFGAFGDLVRTRKCRKSIPLTLKRIKNMFLSLGLVTMKTSARRGRA